MTTQNSQLVQGSELSADDGSHLFTEREIKTMEWATQRLAMGSLQRAAQIVVNHAMPLPKGKHNRTTEVRIPFASLTQLQDAISQAQRMSANNTVRNGEDGSRFDA